jgi:hypothetical protein
MSGRVAEGGDGGEEAEEEEAGARSQKPEARKY